MVQDSITKSQDLLPFIDRKLPRVKDVLYLFLFLQGKAGYKNGDVSKSEVMNIVQSYVLKYWQLAGFPTKTATNIKNKIVKLVTNYQAMKKLTNPSKVNQDKKKVFLENLELLFDIAAPNIEKYLSTD